MIHNDVSKNKNVANVFYQEPGDSTKLPVLEIDWAKNKKSSYKGRTYCTFTPEFSRAVECTEDQKLRFDAIVYSSKM